MSLTKMLIFHTDKRIVNKVFKLNSNIGRISYIQLTASIIGFFSSLWTYLLHIQLKTQSGIPLICDVNETINCSKIIGSSQGELFGIPLGIYGMIYWLIAIGLAFFPIWNHVSSKYISFWRLFLSSIGLITALILMYISYFTLKGICEFCSVVQVTCIAYFVISLISYLKSRRVIFCAIKPAFYNLIFSSILLFIIPITINFTMSPLIEKYYKNIKLEKEQKLQKLQKEYYNNVAIPYSPVFDNTDIDFSKGSSNAQIVIVEFTDFECPYCQVLHDRLKNIEKNIGRENIRIVFRNWPLSYHVHAKKLAIAARCTGLQGKFWEFADWAFSTAKKYSHDNTKKSEEFSGLSILKKVNEYNLDISEFQTCINAQKTINKIQKDIADASTLGGSGTPFLIINMEPYKGNWLKPSTLENYLSKLLIN